MSSEQPAPASIDDWLRRATTDLAQASDSARLDAELLLMHVLGVARAHIYAWPEQLLSKAQAAAYADLVDRRRQGEPVAYLVGHQGFYGLTLRMNPHALIPRPETELLVAFALDTLAHLSGPTVLDLGTGSGAIALAIAHNRPDARVEAVESSQQAALLAQSNAAELALENVAIFSGNWFEPVADHRFDLIVANPPYVADSETDLTSDETRFEPREALYAADCGRAALRRIASGAGEHLLPGGWLAMEHGFRQGADVRAMLADAGYASIDTLRDLAGHERVSIGRRRGHADDDHRADPRTP